MVIWGAKVPFVLKIAVDAEGMPPFQFAAALQVPAELPPIHVEFAPYATAPPANAAARMTRQREVRRERIWVQRTVLLIVS